MSSGLTLEPAASHEPEWTRLVASAPALNLMQTWEFGETKARLGWRVERFVFRNGSSVVGAVQALNRVVPLTRGGLVWINRGPITLDRDAQDTLRTLEMLRVLRRFYVDDARLLLRVAPPLQSSAVEPAALIDAGFESCYPQKQWASGILHLGLPVDELRKRLDQKWRNCLHKAERLRLEISSGIEDELFENLLTEYTRVLGRVRWKTNVTPSFLRALQVCLPSERKMWVVVARKGPIFVGGVLIGRYGRNCEYLVGAISEAGRKENAGHLLLWHAIVQMRAMGFSRFDVGGMHPTDTPPGILHFKRGIGSEPYALVAEVEASRHRLIDTVIRWRIRQAHG